jgi:hypothetical protein
MLKVLKKSFEKPMCPALLGCSKYISQKPEAIIVICQSKDENETASNMC